MGPAVDLKIKPLDTGIPLLQTELEVNTTEHNSLAE